MIPPYLKKNPNKDRPSLSMNVTLRIFILPIQVKKVLTISVKIMMRAVMKKMYYLKFKISTYILKRSLCIKRGPFLGKISLCNGDKEALTYARYLPLYLDS